MVPGLPAISPRYHVDREIGRGGMGSVYLGTDTTLNRQVAIKLLHGAQLDAPSAVSRFVQEGRVCAQLRSDNCVKIFDLGVTESGQPYLVMEFLHGRDLAQELVRSGRFSCERAMSYVTQACSALAEAHQLGVVHRDLKPHNLYLCVGPQGEETIKILDFGVSRLPRATSTDALTSRGDLLGTPAYMSPEQIAVEADIDARSDVWSLGVILYELVSGTTPFDGGTVTQNVFRILHDEARPLSSLVPGVAPDFEAIVAKCLRKNPAERYQNVGALVRDLAQVAQAGHATSRSPTALDDRSALALRPTDLAQPAVYSQAPAAYARTVQSAAAYSPYVDAASSSTYSHTPPVGSYRVGTDTSFAKVAAIVGASIVALLGVGTGVCVAIAALTSSDGSFSRSIPSPSTPSRQESTARSIGSPSLPRDAPPASNTPAKPLTWSTSVRSSAGYAPAAVKSQLEDPVTACARSNEAKLRDAYSVADLQHGFGVMISYDPAGIVRSTGADDLPNIKAWLQACLNDALVDKELGRPVRGVEHREIYLFVKAMP